jgi:hypothetical protein
MPKHPARKGLRAVRIIEKENIKKRESHPYFPRVPPRQFSTTHTHIQNRLYRDAGFPEIEGT